MTDFNCSQNWFVNFLVEKKYRVYRHLLIWAYIIFISYDPGELKEYSGNYNLYIRLLWVAYFLAMVYANMYLLVPRLLFKGKYFTYLVCFVIMVVSSYLIVKVLFEYHFDNYRLFKERKSSSFFREVLTGADLLLLVVFSSTSIKLFQRWKGDMSRITELEKTSLQMELKELKNQINPHFLFNMLNNVNVLVTKDPAKASLIIMKLSDFLRYQLYENNASSVQLSSEIQFLNDFMELEKIRRDDFSFSLTVHNASGGDELPQGLSLPPNMFIVFVENAIKYSIDLDNPSYVRANFTLSGDKLYFTCINSKAKEPFKIAGSGGLGLMNVKRRLELLYGTDFTLNIRDDKYEYEVNLTLPV